MFANTIALSNHCHPVANLPDERASLHQPIPTLAATDVTNGTQTRLAIDLDTPLAACQIKASARIWAWLSSQHQGLVSDCSQGTLPRNLSCV